MEMQTPVTSEGTVPDPADIAIAQAEGRQRRRRHWLIVGGIASLLVSYPLSRGPVLVLDQQDLLPDALSPILKVIYYPIVFALNNKVPPVERFYEWYLGSLGIDI